MIRALHRPVRRSGRLLPISRQQLETIATNAPMTAAPPTAASMTAWRGPGSQARGYSSTTPLRTDTIKVTYIESDGTENVVNAKIGENLLDTAHNNNVELEGACGGDLACSTCHLIFEPEVYKTLPEKEDDEDDMLDLAYGVEETSRLGCQICATKELDGITVRIPSDGL